MLEALAAIGAVIASAVAAWPRERALAAPAAISASGLSLTVSVVGLLGEERTSGWWSLVESFALLSLVFLALRRAPTRSGAVAAALAAAATVVIIPAHATASGSLRVTAAGMAVWGFGALVAAGAARYLEALDVQRARSVADARREQRLSLARDLHDFVAHDVSAIVVQAQAAPVVGEREPGQAFRARAHRAGRAARAVRHGPRRGGAARRRRRRTGLRGTPNQRGSNAATQSPSSARWRPGSRPPGRSRWTSSSITSSLMRCRPR